MTHLPSDPSRSSKPDPVAWAPLHAVGVAPENLRAGEAADEDIPALARTIEAAGLLYPLLVRTGGNGEKPFMALDGRRRLLGLERLAEEGRIDADHPVPMQVVTDKGQQAAALVVSNTQRAPVHVADVIVAIGKLKRLKLTSAKIAASLGYSEIEVRRLQCLAALPQGAIDALRHGRINLRTAKLMARITDPEALGHFTRQAQAGCLYEYTLSTHLSGRPGLDDPMFDLIGVERYREAGGRIDADLFGEFEDVVLDADKLVGLWMDRVGFLVEALKARGYAPYLQRDQVYRAPEGLEVCGPTIPGFADPATGAAMEQAHARVQALATTLAAGERASADRNPELLDYLFARLDQEAVPVSAGRIGGVGLYPSPDTGFELQVFYTPVEEAEDEEERDVPQDEGGPSQPIRNEGLDRPEIVVPAQVVDTEGRNHSLHETYTDIATRGLIRSVADDAMAALTITVARLFAVLALQGSASTECAASTLQARRYSRGTSPAVPTLDGVVRERLEVKRKLYLASGLRPIPWVDTLAHGEKMELLAELIALSLDVREVSRATVRRAARAEAAEIAELTAHDITAYWTPDSVFLAQHTKAQLLAALTEMETDTTPTKGMRKDDLVGYVFSVAAEKRWAPPALNLRLRTPSFVEETQTGCDGGEDAGEVTSDRGRSGETSELASASPVRAERSSAVMSVA